MDVKNSINYRCLRKYLCTKKSRKLLKLARNKRKYNIIFFIQISAEIEVAQINNPQASSINRLHILYSHQADNPRI